MNEVTLDWKWVPKAEDFDANKGFLKEKKGVYLWIIRCGRPEKKRVVGVGETRNSFFDRHIQHFKELLSGTYIFLDLQEGEDFKDILADFWDNKNPEDFKKEGKIWFPNIYRKGHESIKKTFLSEENLKKRLEYLKKLEFAFAEVHPANSEIDFKQIEAALILGIRKVYLSKITKKPVLMRNEEERIRCDAPIGAISKYPTVDFEIRHTGDRDKLPAELLEIKNAGPRVNR